jgi:hypothetical protein
MSSDLQKAMDGLPTNVTLSFASMKRREGIADDDWETPPEKVVVVLAFSEKGFGFGEVAITQTSEGVFVDTECMNLERVKRYFSALLDKAILDTDSDPVRHALYNRVKGRSCGPRCKVCNPGADQKAT